MTMKQDGDILEIYMLDDIFMQTPDENMVDNP